MAVAGYNIYVDGVKHNTSLITDLTYALSGLAASTSYAVTVSAVDTAGNESEQTAAVNFTTQAATGGGGIYIGTGTVDPDYQEVLNHWAANAIPTPDAAQQTADNQWIKDYKATGAWAKEDAIVKLDGNASKSVDAKLTDLKRRVQMIAEGELIWSPTGVKGDGETGYIRSVFAPSDGVNYSLNNAGVLCVKTASHTGTDMATWGSVQDKKNNHLFDNFLDGTYININGENTGSMGGLQASYIGLNAVNRDLASEIKIDKSTRETKTFPSTAALTLSTIEFYILARNNGVSGNADMFSDTEISLWTAGASKAAEHAAIKAMVE